MSRPFSSVQRDPARSERGHALGAGWVWSHPWCELMHEAWGRTYTQKDTLNCIERSIQMLAKMGDPDSSVVNA